MDMVMGWLSKLDFTAIIASVVTFLAGITIVKIQLGKALKVIGDVAELLGAISKSLDDGKLDKAEIEAIVKEGQELIADFKK